MGPDVSAIRAQPVLSVRASVEPPPVSTDQAVNGGEIMYRRGGIELLTASISASPTGQQECHIMENVTLTQKEQTRLQVLNSLVAEQMTVDQAATLMGVSTRHTRRILAAYREEGAAALAHGHRGRRAPNTTPEALRSEVLRLARTRYSDANHTHLGELLREREGIEIGRTTLRRILTGAGLKSPRRRRPPRHVKRQELCTSRKRDRQVSRAEGY